MAKGVPILGKDPLGKAKYANVTESGDLRVQLSGSIVADTKPQAADLARRAYDAIIDTVGLENIALLLPLWEAEGTTFADMLDPDLQFQATGAVTPGASGLLHSVVSFSGGCLMEVPIQANTAVADTSITIASPTHKIAQRVSGITLRAGKARFSVKKVGTLTSATVIRYAIYDDNAGTPGNLVGATTTMHGGHLSATYAMNGLPWETPPGMLLRYNYWLVVEVVSSAELDASNYIEFAAMSAGGKGLATFNGAAWTVNEAGSCVHDLYNDALTFPLSAGGISIIAAAQLTNPVRSGRFIINTSSTSDTSCMLGHSLDGCVAGIVRATAAHDAKGYRWPINRHHVYAVSLDYAADSNRLQLYLDGRQIGSASGTAGQALIPAHQPWTVGAGITRGGSFNSYWAGTIGPILMVRGALTPAQIADVSKQILTLRAVREAV